MFRYDTQRAADILPAETKYVLIQRRTAVDGSCHVTAGICVQKQEIKRRRNEIILFPVAVVIFLRAFHQEGHQMPNLASITGSHHILKHSEAFRAPHTFHVPYEKLLLAQRHNHTCSSEAHSNNFPKTEILCRPRLAFYLCRQRWLTAERIQGVLSRCLNVLFVPQLSLQREPEIFSYREPMSAVKDINGHRDNVRRASLFMFNKTDSDS